MGSRAGKEPPPKESGARRRKNERLAGQPASNDPAVPPDVGKLVDEIRIRGIELEVQNEELRAAQEDLSASRDAYLELFENAPVGYLTIDAEGAVRNANLTACRLLGVTREDLVAAPFARFVSAVDQDAFYLRHRRLLATEQPESCELRLRRQEEGAPGDSQFWARLEARPQAPPDGPLACWVTFADVTARRLAEEAAHESEVRYRGYFEQSLMGAMVADADGRLIDANQAACDLLGYVREELLKLTWTDLTHPEDVAAEVERNRRVVAGKVEGLRIQKRFIRKDGHVVHADMSLQCQRAPDGRVIHFLALFSEVTEQVELRAAREAFEARLRAAVDSMLDPHVLLDAVRDENGKIVDFVFADANRAACEFNGLPYDELIGARFLGQHPAAGSTDLFDRYRVVLETGEPLVLDDWSYPQDLLGGEQRHYDVRAVGVGDAVSQTWRDVTERHSAAEIRAASEEAYRLIAENAADVVLRGDMHGVVRWVSPSLTALTGWRPDELIGHKPSDFFHPDDLPKVLAAQPDVGQGAPVQIEARLRLANGDYRWVASAIRPVLDEAGSVVGRVEAWRDIRPEVEAREALHEMASLRDFSERVGRTGSWRWDLETGGVTWSAGMYLLHDLKRDEFSGDFTSVIEQRIHPDDREAVREAFWRYRGSGGSLEFDYRVVWRDGSVHTIHSSGSDQPVGAVPGSVLTGLSVDVTEQQSAENSLRLATDRLTLATRAGGVGVWDWEVGEDTLTWDEQMYALYGIPPDQFAGAYEAWQAGLHPDDRVRGDAEIQAALRGEKEFDTEFRVLWQDGTEHAIRALALVQRDETGAPTRMIGTNWDITELKAAEAEIRRLNADLERRVAERTRDLTVANAELEDFVYSIAHDLRSPLRALAGFSEIVNADYGEVIDETGQGYLHRIHAAATHMGDVMDALLALSRVNRTDLLVKDVDLSDLACRVADQLREADPQRSVEFEIEDGLVARADSSLCEVLLQNLLGNAWKFSVGESPARISFGRATVDGRSVFCASDNGVGFEQKYAGRLFKPFERLHAPGEFPGTGIGLATVGRIVSRFEGQCWAEGCVGEGAKIFFTLPAPESAD